MSAKQFLLDMAITFPIAFVVAAITTFGYSRIAYGLGVVNWETAFELGVILAIVLPLAVYTTAKTNAPNKKARSV